MPHGGVNFDVREESERRPELEIARQETESVARRQCGLSRCFFVIFDFWFMPMESLNSTVTKSRTTVTESLTIIKHSRTGVLLLPTQPPQQAIQDFLLTQAWWVVG